MNKGLMMSYAYRKYAVFAACDLLGGRSSSEELQQESSRLYGKDINVGYCMAMRVQWRKNNGCEDIDCRRYNGQPRRNMLNDKLTDLGQVKRLNKFLTTTKSTPDMLINLIGHFHSSEQLLNALADLQEVQLKAA